MENDFFRNNIFTNCFLSFHNHFLLSCSLYRHLDLSHPHIAIHTLHNFTFTEWFGAIPGTVLGADESGGPVSIHGETRRTLETDCVVVGQIIP